jgi:hypothetical protein
MVVRGLVGLSLVLSFALVACSVTESVEVPTDAIAPQFRVVAGQGATHVTVVLFRAGPGANRLELSAGDALTARLGAGAPVALQVTEPGSIWVRYTGMLDAATEGDEVVVAFERARQESAPATRLAVPQAPVVSAPTDGSTQARFEGDPTTLDVAWTPLPGDLSVEVSLDLVSCDGLDAEETEALAALVGLPGQLYDGASGAASVDVLGLVDDQACVADVLIGAVSQVVGLDPAFAGERAGTRIVHLAPPPRVTFETTTF